MKSIEKLRKVAEEQTISPVLKLVRTYTDHTDIAVTNGEISEALRVAVDEIDDELEDGYMELPRDMDGNPIHVGTVLMKVIDGTDTGIECVTKGVGNGSVFVSYDDEDGEYGLVSYEVLSSTFRLKHNDSWERIERDARRLVCEEGITDGVMMLIIERCKALAGMVDA